MLTVAGHEQCSGTIRCEALMASVRRTRADRTPVVDPYPELVSQIRALRHYAAWP